jgi:hypothetical protein
VLRRAPKKRTGDEIIDKIPAPEHEARNLTIRAGA